MRTDSKFQRKVLTHLCKHGLSLRRKKNREKKKNSDHNDDDDSDNDENVDNNITIMILMMMMTMAIIIMVTKARLTLKDAIRDFLQRPHCVANCLRHVRSNKQGAIVCKSHATQTCMRSCMLCMCAGSRF